jgi:hypothetical protein
MQKWGDTPSKPKVRKLGDTPEGGVSPHFCMIDAEDC